MSSTQTHSLLYPAKYYLRALQFSAILSESRTVKCIRAAQPAEETRTMGSETILMAEDEREIREMFKEFLESQGYRVFAAADGEEALEIFSARHRSIDLVILDAMMPKLNGPEVYDRMKSLSKDLRCLFLTGYSEEIFQRSLNPGFKIPILRKPITFQELEEKVREVLDQPTKNNR